MRGRADLRDFKSARSKFRLQGRKPQEVDCCVVMSDKGGRAADIEHQRGKLTEVLAGLWPFIAAVT